MTFSPLSSVPHPTIETGLSSGDKKRRIAASFGDILTVLGLDLANDSLRSTPDRYATMLVDELFSGLDDNTFPRITTQQNSFGYDQPLIEINIAVQSVCEHHFVPILGHCHIGYVPSDAVVGLSKLNRVTEHYARRPQVQERMTRQIRSALSDVLDTPDVAVTIDAVHLCVRMRGIQDQDAVTRTSDLGGRFASELRREFFEAIPRAGDVSL